MPDYKLVDYELPDGRRPFRSWLKRLDLPVQVRISARLARLAKGHWGPVRNLGAGLNEIIMDFGPGYRLYYGFRRQVLVILLLGGDKKSQARDINMARKYWKDFLEVER